MSSPIRIMGVVNATSDSFSDGGRYLEPQAAVGHALALLAAGADILDIGGESTRPGAEPVSEAEEASRVVPVIAALACKGATISVDTMKPSVARAAVAAGATIWNDVTALGYAADSLETAAELGCEVVLMHMQGEPRTMQAAPSYQDVVAEVCSFLHQRAEAALSAGVPRDRIWLDPGIGFGKRLQDNLALLAAMDQIAALSFPVLLGVSRKRFIAGLDPSAQAPQDRLAGSLAAILACAEHVAAVRVHDVAETRQALRVWDAVRSAR